MSSLWLILAPVLLLLAERICGEVPEGAVEKPQWMQLNQKLPRLKEKEVKIIEKRPTFARQVKTEFSPEKEDINYILNYQEKSNADKLNHVFSYEVFEEGQRKDVEVTFDLNSLSQSIESYYKADADAPHRTKRDVFGYDTRFALKEDYPLKYPFSTTVKLSTNCSGILVGPKHVLTAAQCVHDGEDYVQGADKLRVGILRVGKREGPPVPGADPFYWIRATKTYIPKGWMQGVNQLDFDYSVIELRRKHEREYMDIGVYAPGTEVNRVHLSAFDDPYDSSQITYRFCPISEETPDKLYQFCDTYQGGIGSGMYVRLWDQEKQEYARRVVGVHNGHQWVQRSGTKTSYNVAVRITPLKMAQICFWARGDFNQCGNDK